MKIARLAANLVLGFGLIVAVFSVSALATRLVIAAWDAVPETTLLIAAMAGIALVWGALRSTRRRWSK